MIKGIIHILVFVLLTLITQIGGVIYLFSVLIIKRKKKRYRLKRFLVFASLYLFATYLVVPNTSSFISGRVQVQTNTHMRAHNFLTGLLNRNYVSKDLHESLIDIASKVNNRFHEIQLIYLDANFPFFDGFPLLPHLSHNDGKKIDISFIYNDQNGIITNRKPSNSGYGVFEEPKENEFDQTKECKEKGAWQYDYPKYLTFGVHKELSLNEKATKELVELFTQNPKVKKVFIEPHLKRRLRLSSSKIRFQGCKAVRHDDHIHVEIN
ncbi:hypothetical protein [Pseudotenacibaculum haliotis]|uniref:Uncharacterized protein n=1 Tax=Pseudotenacibaculum haliotis TaxID=1862138 RepID=A0ABW5LQG1_9FLAO